MRYSHDEKKPSRLEFESEDEYQDALEQWEDEYQDALDVQFGSSFPVLSRQATRHAAEAMVRNSNFFTGVTDRHARWRAAYATVLEWHSGWTPQQFAEAEVTIRSRKFPWDEWQVLYQLRLEREREGVFLGVSLLNDLGD